MLQYQFSEKTFSDKAYVVRHEKVAGILRDMLGNSDNRSLVQA
jgi:hypothetical protein